MKVTIYLKEPEGKWIRVSMSEEMYEMFIKMVKEGEGVASFVYSKSPKKSVTIAIQNIAYHMMEEE